MLKKLAIGIVVAAAVLAAGGWAAHRLSPWPMVWGIRYVFAQGGAAGIASAEPFLPDGIVITSGLAYAPDEPEALLDVFFPADAEGPLPTVIWVHGGGFVAGSREELNPYLRILAGRGFTTVSIDYARAPVARFPTPVHQLNAAIAYVLANAERFNADPTRIFLGGDSAGAQIAAQTALAIVEPDYARSIGVEPGMAAEALKGAVLFCGPYDPTVLNYDGAFGGFMRTVIWSYVGTRDPSDPRVAQMAVTPHVTAAFPPSFVSVGNADPLAPQSYDLAAALEAQGVEVDTLFFPEDHEPPLAHEYQLILSGEDAQLALERTVAFLRARS